MGMLIVDTAGSYRMDSHSTLSIRYRVSRPSKIDDVTGAASQEIRLPIVNLNTASFVESDNPKLESQNIIGFQTRNMEWHLKTACMPEKYYVYRILNGPDATWTRDVSSLFLEVMGFGGLFHVAPFLACVVKSPGSLRLMFSGIKGLREPGKTRSWISMGLAVSWHPTRHSWEAAFRHTFPARARRDFRKSVNSVRLQPGDRRQRGRK
ncbi:hypothetical protein QBC45DRAFT_239270 [Copromyces sp. CBS 386.78]|nr:hypothetical protein QBC45DRAFT_239270 [Copromyces sp. CBS 386.78]